jgi:Flp pilus assembly protein CpaB
MKRNMVPLLGIAFVVAILSTGLFYGLFAGKLHSAGTQGPSQTLVVAARNLDRGTVLQASDLRVAEIRGGATLASSFAKPEDAVGWTILDTVSENEPLSRKHAASKNGGGEGSSAVKSGMRAVSVRVSESAGVVSLLHSGSRVDVQAVTDRNGTTELRTIVQNIEVLAVGTPLDAGPGTRVGTQVVTLLAQPRDADLAALADSGGRVRLLLRNPLDGATALAHPASLPGLFHDSSAERAETAHAGPAPVALTAAVAKSAVQSPDTETPLWVRLVSVSAGALAELDPSLKQAGGGFRVVNLAGSVDAVDRLEKEHLADVVAASRVVAGSHRPAVVRAGHGTVRLRLQFTAETHGGKLSLRVRPELTRPSGEGTETRSMDAAVELGTNRAAVVSGFIEEPGKGTALEGLFPGHWQAGRELVVLVTAPGARRTETAGLGAGGRGR